MSAWLWCDMPLGVGGLPGNRTELAKALAGDEHQNAQAAIQRVRQRVREGFARNRAFEQGKPMNVRDKIGLALGRGAEAGAEETD